MTAAERGFLVVREIIGKGVHSEALYEILCFRKGKAFSYISFDSQDMQQVTTLKTGFGNDSGGDNLIRWLSQTPLRRMKLSDRPAYVLS